MLNDTNLEEIVCLINNKGLSDQHQLVILMEELSELIKECSKIIRSRHNLLSNGLIEEFSHVQISMAVIQSRYDIKNEDLYDNVINKTVSLKEEK